MNEIITNMPEAEYHSHPAVSKHGLDLIRKAPAHYRFAKDNPVQEATLAMKFGTLAHLAILEPERYERETFVMPRVDRRTKEGKAAYEEAMMVAEGRLIVTPEEHATLMGMQTALRTNDECIKVLDGATHIEPSLFWVDPMLDVACRARIDVVTPTALVDYKTTDDASYEAFSKSVFNFRYHVQAAFYLHAWRQCGGTEPMKFLFIAQERKAPYLTAIYELTQPFLDLGDEEWLRDLSLYRHCMRTNTWPDYETNYRRIDIPRWLKPSPIAL